MKKLARIILGTVAMAAGALTGFYLVTKYKNPKLKDPCENGLYTINIFKKITRDMNRAIADTEKRLADHDKIQKMYDNMEWHTS